MRILAILLAASLTACAGAGNNGPVGAKAGAPTVFAVDDEGAFTTRAAIWFASDPVKATKAAKARMLSEARRNGFTHFTLQGYRSYLLFGQHVFLQGKFFRPGAAPSEALPLDALTYASVGDDGRLEVAPLDPPAPSRKPVRKAKRPAPKAETVRVAAPVKPAPVQKAPPPVEPVKAVAPVETKAAPAAIETKAAPAAVETKPQTAVAQPKAAAEVVETKAAPAAAAKPADAPLVIEAPEFVEDPAAPKKPVR